MMRRERRRVTILGIPLDKVGYEGACHRVEVFLEADGAKTIVTPNAEIIMMAQEDGDLKAALANADLCFPDGIGVVMASKILGQPLKGRTAGFDLMMRLLEMMNLRQGSIYLIGGKPGIAELAAVNIKVKFPQISVVGTRYGYFTEDEEPEIIKEINSAKPTMLLVALGAPKQEIFMHKFKDQLLCDVMMGVGGSLDVLSGKVQRAPAFMQKAGLEWLYRLLAQPSRVGRVMVLPVFLMRIIGIRLRKTLLGSP